MLTDILWEDQKMSLNIRIATLINYIPGPLFQYLTQKKTPNKINYQGFNFLLLLINISNNTSTSFPLIYINHIIVA